MDKYRIIVAHPGQQHSYRLAAALNRYGCLFTYMTTVYNKKNGPVLNFCGYSLMRKIKNVWKDDDATK